MGGGSGADGALAPVLSLARQQLASELRERCEGFLTRYFQHLARADLKARDPRDLVGAALAHLRLGEHRDKGAASVHVFNPDLATAGWQSPHTVVQVVTDDMPFLVDSVRMVMTTMRLGIHLVLHPMLRVAREGSRYDHCDDGTANEAWMYLEVDRCDPVRLEELRKRLLDSLDDVRVAVTDWRTMRDRCDQLAHDLEHSILPLGSGEGGRAATFLRWLSDDHFIFLGYREYEYTQDDEGTDLVVVTPSTGLGLLRDGEGPRSPIGSPSSPRRPGGWPSRPSC